MVKILLQDGSPKKAALVMAFLLGILHFGLSAFIGPRANEIFQVWFDTGKPYKGVDAIVMWLELLLSLPIPTLFFARHPARGLPLSWWLATALNGVVWSGLAYSFYCIVYHHFDKLRTGKSQSGVMSLTPH